MMKRGMMALLLVGLALIVAFVACSGRGVSTSRSGCGGCGLGCAACTACIAAGCALSCARGLSGTLQTDSAGSLYH
jgi:hypothetical protein